MGRRLLMMVGAIALVVVFTLVAWRSADRVGERTTASLAAALKSEAAQVPIPWVLAHGLLAFGSDWILPDGQRPADLLFGRYLRPGDAVAGPHFELFLGDGRPGEVHPHLVLKVWSEVSPTDPRNRELVAAALFRQQQPTDYRQWNDVAWLIEATARLGVDPAQTLGGGTSPGGGSLTLRTLAIGALNELEASDRVVEQALAATPFQRPGGSDEVATSGTWAFTCGGQHLLQALLVAADWFEEPDRQRLTARLTTFLARLRAEDAFRLTERQRAEEHGISPARALRESSLLRLKLLGHGLETLARARAAGIGQPAEIAATADWTRNTLLAMLAALNGSLDLGQHLPRVRGTALDRWQLWFGDGCHALHGLALWEPSR